MGIGVPLDHPEQMAAEQEMSLVDRDFVVRAVKAGGGTPPGGAEDLQGLADARGLRRPPRRSRGPRRRSTGGCAGRVLDGAGLDPVAGSELERQGHPVGSTVDGDDRRAARGGRGHHRREARRYPDR